MSYLFIKNLFQRKKFKKPKKPIFSEFFFFLGRFFIANPAARWPACWWSSDRRCGAVVCC
jgi:hypothetical protein